MHSTRIYSRIATAARAAVGVAILAGGFSVVTAVPASAAPNSKVNACLEGDIGPYDVVGSWTSDHKYRLKCGDPTKGLLHIADGHGGDGHTEKYGKEFLKCLSRIATTFNDKDGNTPGTTLRTYTNDYGTASFLFDNRSKDILTAYTKMGRSHTGPSDANWARCASDDAGITTG
ncbi:hypothetical protein [Streptomyces sp. XD-27]|uniref:hypothetical protein n=1 Tax=Streptomyces sp. XD-27 TaxID=3062779 RepID=UPI0026F452F4|nr:hypothetical protein [Streptomyces sp. XD-27]WKX71239.1 hypothetical protein Q3Y56_16205 [Streptomyces sp. XD-27]